MFINHITSAISCKLFHISSIFHNLTFFFTAACAIICSVKAESEWSAGEDLGPLRYVWLNHVRQDADVISLGTRATKQCNCLFRLQNYDDDISSGEDGNKVTAATQSCVSSVNK